MNDVTILDLFWLILKFLAALGLVGLVGLLLFGVGRRKANSKGWMGQFTWASSRRCINGLLRDRCRRARDSRHIWGRLFAAGGWPTFDLYLGTTTTEAAAPFATFERCALHPPVARSFSLCAPLSLIEPMNPNPGVLSDTSRA
jgi:hypothetical protein